MMLMRVNYAATVEDSPSALPGSSASGNSSSGALAAGKPMVWFAPPTARLPVGPEPEPVPSGLGAGSASVGGATTDEGQFPSALVPASPAPAFGLLSARPLPPAAPSSAGGAALPSATVSSAAGLALWLPEVCPSLLTSPVYRQYLTDLVQSHLTPASSALVEGGDQAPAPSSPTPGSHQVGLEDSNASSGSMSPPPPLGAGGSSPSPGSSPSSPELQPALPVVLATSPPTPPCPGLGNISPSHAATNAPLIPAAPTTRVSTSDADLTGDASATGWAVERSQVKPVFLMVAGVVHVVVVVVAPVLMDTNVRACSLSGYAGGHASSFDCLVYLPAAPAARGTAHPVGLGGTTSAHRHRSAGFHRKFVLHCGCVCGWFDAGRRRERLPLGAVPGWVCCVCATQCC